MQKIIVDNYTNLQHGEFECDCLDIEANKEFNEIVTIDEVIEYLTPSVQDMSPYVYFNELGINDTCSLFSEIINKRLNRTELPDMPDVFGALGAILKPDYTDMAQDMAHSHIVNPDIIS